MSKCSNCKNDGVVTCPYTFMVTLDGCAPDPCSYFEAKEPPKQKFYSDDDGDICRNYFDEDD